MANPQKENGSTDIASELLEAIYTYDFTATKLKIVLCVLRFTYGFKRKSHKLSATFIKNAIGNKSKRFIAKEIKELIDNKILVEYENASYNSMREIGINKDYTCWEKHKPVYSSVHSVLTDTQCTQECQTSVPTSAQPVYLQVHQDTIKEDTIKEDTKNILIKNDINEELKTKFDIIWQMYPRKVGKNKAFKYFVEWVTKGRKTEINNKRLKLTPFQIFNAVDIYSQEVADRDEKYIQHGSTFFNMNLLDYISDEEENINEGGNYYE